MAESAERGAEIARLISLLAALPGLGPRSARRAVLHLITRREESLKPLITALTRLDAEMRQCPQCGAIDIRVPCRICADPRRSGEILCVVEHMGDLWALERAEAFRGRYHVLGGALCALDGVGPEDLNIASLLERARNPELREIILATNATVDGQTTAHYLAEKLSGMATVSRLARGVPIGSELDYMDDGTLADALRQRRPF